MKKVFLTLFAVLLAVPAFAVEVYNNGDNSVAIYGNFRGYAGYGLSVAGDTTSDMGGTSVTGTDGALGHNMLYGLQGNSRIGTNIKVGNFTAQFELGANEPTLVSASPATSIGIRQAWGAYTFGNGSKLLVGKTDTPTAMGGFNSSFYDTDGGLNGFGGTVTGSRRFQVQYSIAGLTLALIEDDMNFSNGGGALGIANFDDSNTPYTPRAGISYVFQNESLLAKIAATYTAVNGYYLSDPANPNSAKNWTNLHAFGVTLGVKPTFGNMWVSILARYGMNEDLYGEGKTVANIGEYGHANYNSPNVGISPFGLALGQTINSDGSFNNVHRAGGSIEFGIKATENFTAVIGGGYQATIQEVTNAQAATIFPGATDPSYLVHSYAVFLQGQYKLSQNFALVPEIAWFGTIANGSAKVGDQNASVSDSQSGLLVGLQFRATF